MTETETSHYGFWEIWDRDGSKLIQRITVLTAQEIRNLRSAGFIIKPLIVDKSLNDGLRSYAWKQIPE